MTDRRTIQHAALGGNNRSFSAEAEAEAVFSTHVGEFDLFETLADHESHPADLKAALKRMAASTAVSEDLDIAYRGLRTAEVHGRNVDYLAAVVERQATFADKMANLLWLRSPAAARTLERAIARYEHFLVLFREHPGRTLVPTLDIDLAWHTQQCSPALYDAACRQLAGRDGPIEHDDTIERPVLRDAFAATTRLYEARFHDEYNPCLCWDCEALKSELAPRGTTAADDEVDFEAIVQKVQHLVRFHQAVELARRSGKPLPAWKEA